LNGLLLTVVIFGFSRTALYLHDKAKKKKGGKTVKLTVKSNGISKLKSFFFFAGSI